MSDIYPVYDGDLDWMDGAMCRGLPTNWWHPTKGQGRSPRKFAAMARAVCAACPFTNECLDYGRQTKSSGIYGGVLLTVGSLPRKRGKQHANS